MLTPEECKAWLKNPVVNPRTNRKISPTGAVYKMYKNECVTPKSPEQQSATKNNKNNKNNKNKEYTPADCAKWHKDPSRDPVSKRKISAEAKTGVYSRLVKLCGPVPKTPRKSTPVTPKSPEQQSATKYKKKSKNIKYTPADCAIWHKDQSRDPVSKRKISAKAKTGVYSQLVKLCGPVPKTPRRSTPQKQDIDVQRKRLLTAFKSAVLPLMDKGNFAKTRIKFKSIMQRYLAKLQPCVEEQNGKLCLVTKDGKPVVHFDKQIGSESVYGMAYMNMGKGLARFFRFSCKLMDNRKAHTNEIVLLKAMSMMAERNISPNMPITYLALKCKNACTRPVCPLVTQKTGYYVVLNELADGDMNMWFQQPHSIPEYESVLMQMMLAMCAFHELGYSHNDCHFGNFLVHKIKPGGCWRYKVRGHDVYVPNLGYLVVMWDPGLAKKFVNEWDEYPNDYERVLRLILGMHTIYKPDQNMVQPPAQFLNDVVNMFRVYSGSGELKYWDDTIAAIKHKTIKLSTIIVDDKPIDYLLNIKPYEVI